MEELYFLYSENKDIDQMHGYCTALLFWYVPKLDFLMIRLLRSLAVCYFICILRHLFLFVFKNFHNKVIRCLNIKVFYGISEYKDQWTTEEIQILERYFDLKVSFTLLL